MTYVPACGNARSLIHKARPGIKPTSSCILVGSLPLNHSLWGTPTGTFIFKEKVKVFPVVVIKHDFMSKFQMYGTFQFCHCVNIILSSLQTISISYMEIGNQTAVLKFILLGLSGDVDLQPLLFGLFLSMYLVTVLGNLLIILAITSDSHLHTPMYFFLSNLSFTDICFTSTTLPKMLVNIQMQKKDITYEGCLTQMYFFMIFACEPLIYHDSINESKQAMKGK
uniref:G-protein coupled receptors family 1 profile domain-containing protein n=1 Tax=Catagonus wagneri TaxID=51154 RepID=A0A8C3WA08_9CETA